MEDEVLQKFQQAIMFLADKIESLQASLDAECERTDNLEDLLTNQIIGGIKNLFDADQRNTGISGLKDKYGEKLSPFESALPALGVQDWSSELYDHLNSQKDGNPDWNDESEGSEVDNLVSKLQERIAQIQSATGAKPVAAEVTLAKPEDSTEDLMSAVKKLRDSGDPRFMTRK